MRSLRVLLIGPDASHVERRTDALEAAGFSPAWQRAKNVAGIRLPADRNPEVILIERRAASDDEFQLLQTIAETEMDIPWIVVADTIDVREAQELVRRGAADVVVDPPAGLLGVAVERALREREQLREQRCQSEALRSVEARFFVVFDLAPDVVYIKDEVLRFTLVNPVTQRLLGAPQSEIHGRTAAQVPQADRATAFAASDARVIEGNVVDEQVEIPTDAGPRRYFSLKVPLRVGDRVVGLCGVLHDITDDVRATEALRASENRWRSLVENAPAIIATIDREGTILSINRTVSGMAPERLAGIRLETFLPAPEQARLRTMLETVFERRTSVEYEIATPGLDARIVHFQNNIVPLIEADRVGAALFVSTDITKRARAEQALKESEQRFRTLFEAVPIGVYRTDMAGVIVDANPALARMLGTSEPQFLIGVDLAEIQSDWNDREQSYLDRGRWEGSGGYETRWRRRDGETIWVRKNVRAVPDDDGRVGFFQGAVEDVTERKRAEEQLARQAQLDQVILDSLPCVALLLRPQTREIVASNRAAARLGAVPGTRCYETWRRRKSPCPFCLAPVAWTSGEAQHLEVETDGVAWDAHWIPVSEDLFMHYAFDITERKRAERALAASETRWRTLFELAPAFISIVDRDGTFLSVNRTPPAFTPETIIGTSAYRYLPREGQDALRLALDRVFDQRQTVSYECAVVRRDGSTVWYHNNVAPIQAHDGTVAAIHLSTDITDRKRSEADARQLTEALRLLTSRMESIREEERRRIARQIHDDVGQMLTALRMDVGWLRHRTGPEEDLKERLRSMDDVVGGLIATARRISQELHPKLLEDLGLAAALEWQAAEFEKHSGIVCVACIDPPDLFVEPSLATPLYRILQEALTNVARHAQATQVEVCLERQTARLEMTVSDNGRGITQSDAGGPTSLGLLYMRERAIACGGTLAVKGGPEGGTMVMVSIPLEESRRA